MPQPVSLDSLAGDIEFRKQLLSENVARSLLRLFRLSVRFTVVLTIVLVFLDYLFMAMGYITPKDRLITEKVLLAIVGATIIQVGAGMAAITYALFRQAPKSDASSDLL